MKHKEILLVMLMTLISATGFFYAQEKSEELSILEGPYIGQPLPGIYPEIFAPGIISTGLHDDYGPAIAKDGNEIYFRIWGKPHAILWVIKRVDGKWGEPEVAPFSGQYEDGGFIFSKDENRIYFDSDRPLDNKDESKDTDIWIVDRDENGWGKPINLGAPINSTDDEYIGSVTADKTIYFTVRKRLADGKFSFKNYSSRWKDTAYSKPEKLPYPFNSDYFQIAPRFSLDESYAILTINGREDGIGQEDLYVTFKKEDGTWTEPQNLGAQVNSSQTDWFPSFSPDGKYLFFVSWRHTGEKNPKTKSRFEEKMMKFYKEPSFGHGADIFWVDTKVIEELKPEGLKKNISALVLLGEWFGDAYFPLKEEIDRRGWTMNKVGVDIEYRGCYNKKRDVVLRSDILIPDLEDFCGFDCLIIPSGPQWRKFNENPRVLQFVRDAHASGLLIASFCVGNLTVKAAGLVDFPMGPDLFPAEVIKVKERILLGPRGGGPPPGDGFESAPIKEICDAIARELKNTSADESYSILKGLYLGQKPPGTIPELFAPGIISTKDKYELNSVFSPNGDEFYYEISTTRPEEKERGEYFYIILTSKMVNGVWTKPELAPFSGEYSTMDMCFSPDGNRLYFTSDRPNSWDSSPKNNIWYVDRSGQGWSDPKILRPPIYLPEVRQGQASIAATGTIYFRTGDDLFYSKAVNGKYSEPVKLSEAINSQYAEGKPFIAPDESCLLFIRYDMPATINGGRGLYISFRREDGSWTSARNTNILGSLPKITPDGKYFFFSRGGDIYWVDAKVIYDLKPKELR